MKNPLAYAAALFAAVWMLSPLHAEYANPSMRHIQRTMKMLEESTAENPAHVRVLFYGQSIVASRWPPILMATLTNRYPTVKFEWTNRAIGGFTSENLIRTAESDLYPYYPDLLFFHVYGPHEYYEEIVRRVRERTSAEVVLWSSHVKRSEDPVKMLRERDARTQFIADVAERYGTAYVDLNRKWSEMMVGRGYTHDDLLKDSIHMKNDPGCPALASYAAFIGGELVRLPGCDGTPETNGTITEIPFDDPRVRKNADGSFTLAFDGNRVVAVANGRGKAGARAKLLLDGRDPGAYPELFANTRPSAIVMWMPTVKTVGRTPSALPVAEQWKLTYLDGTKRDGSSIRYRVDGSVTGFDGEGVSTQNFVSRSGRATIDASDFHVWQYGYVKKQTNLGEKRFAKPGDTIRWETVKLFADPYVAASSGERTVLVQNCANGRHELTLVPQGGAPGIGSFLVYAPAKKWGKTTAAVDVRVRQTAGGPRIFVDGVPARPRFYYGSPACLAAISESFDTTFTLPFRAAEDTDRACAVLEGDPTDKPFTFLDAHLVDVTTGVTNALFRAGETRETLRLELPGLRLVKDHLYRVIVKHHATRNRQFFTHHVTYPGKDGCRVELPLPYGDTLADTVRLAAAAGVDFITCSTDNSYGCNPCWNPPGMPDDFGPIDRMVASVVAANPKALVIPRVNVDAPKWMLERDPSMRMKFARGFTIDAPSLSARAYRQAACAHLEKLTRHLRAKFPRNFAGLHVGGQNSSEWFYHLSQSNDLSGYDIHTRDAFRRFLAARGEPDAATAEVPSPEVRGPNGPKRRDGVRDRRLLQFAEFRQLEVATFLSELGAAVRRGSEGHVLALFFYGYSFELGNTRAGAAETGHYALEWLLANGRANIDGLSSPFSYSNRRWPGSVPVMSPAETITRAGMLWIDEDDTRTFREDIWCYKAVAGGRHDTFAETRDILVRNACVGIFKGYGDWWMDLFGRGWYRDAKLWDLRAKLNALDDAMLARTHVFEPEIAVVVDEPGFLNVGWGGGLCLARKYYDVCGAAYGQYFLSDILKQAPARAKLYYVPVVSAKNRAAYEAYKKAHPQAVFVEPKSARDFAPAVIAERARRAGVHLFTKPGAAIVLDDGAGRVLVFAEEGGTLEVDFGAPGMVTDYFTGASLGCGPKLALPFRKGESRIFTVAR